MSRHLCAALIGLLTLGGSAFAHHSFAGQFDNSIAVSPHGVVTSVEMVNPHSFIFIETRTNDVVERWALEGPGPLQVKRRGLDPAFIKVGDELGACGYLTKAGVPATMREPASSKPARILQAAVLDRPGAEKLVWNNYRQEKCGLDK